MVNMSATDVPERDLALPIRTHAEVVRAVGAQKLRTMLIERGFELPNPTTTQRWADRDSIPGEYWNALAAEKVATLEELAAHAEARKVA